MMHRPFVFCFILLATLVCGLPRAKGATITVDTSTTYQTIRGWGCLNSVPDFLTPEFRSELIREVVDEYGLNRLRIEIPAGNSTSRRRWEWFNDNAQSGTTDWSKLALGAMDENLSTFTGPFVDLVRSNGDPFDSYVSFSFYTSGSSGPPPAWILNNPGEYVEFAMSLLLRLKHIYGIEPNYICVLNEPAYNNVFTDPIITELLKELGKAMETAGLATRIQYPEAVSIDAAYNTFIAPNALDDELWSWVGNVSYHRYGGTTKLPDLAAFAISKGLPTAMTEHDAMSLDRLYEDLVTGNNSYWEVYGLASEVLLDNQHYNFLERGSNYWRFRQIFKNVRPGATRVRATSDVPAAKLLAWVKDGKTILNFWSHANTTLEIEGLTPGTYGLSSARLSAAYIERGLRTVGVDGKLTLTGLDTSAMYALYPHPGGNLPPVFTNFKPSVSHLVLPTSTFTLSAAAQDPELNAIAFSWSLTDAPAGATVNLATPNAASCVVTGLTVPGHYTFTVSASDGSGSTQRQVRMEVFASNPAPDLWTIHNRIPVVLTLPASATTLRSSVWNLDNDPLTYQWSVTSQPAGAAAQFATPTAAETTVSGMTVAGDYVFRLTVSDGTTQDSMEHTVPVYPVNAAPTVSAATNASNLTLPVSSTDLTSTSADSNGDTLSHWWRVLSAPAGARPIFTAQRSPDTSVSGLIVPGTYSFQHVVTDESSFKNSNTVTVTVLAGSNPELLALASPNGGETYAPGQTVKIRWASANFAGNVKLEFFDGSAWSEVNASTPNDGIEAWTVPATQRSGCRIRISDVSDGLPADESNMDFRIVGPDLFKIIKIEGDFVVGPTLEWTSLPGGYSYQVHYSETLMADDWHPVGPPQVAQAGEYDLSFTDTSAIGEVRRFYRVVETMLE